MPVRSVRSYPLALGMTLVGAMTFAPPAARAADDPPAAQPATPPADLDSRVKELEETVRQLREQIQQLQQAPKPTVDPAQIQKAVQAAEQSKDLWATINICDSRLYPNRIGIRAEMPSLAFAAPMYMTFEVAYRPKPNAADSEHGDPAKINIPGGQINIGLTSPTGFPDAPTSSPQTA